jgi:hypothetical protein
MSFEAASNLFIQNWALLAHIHLHLVGACFTKLMQGPFYPKLKIRFIRTKGDTSIKNLAIQSQRAEVSGERCSFGPIIDPVRLISRVSRGLKL